MSKRILVLDDNQDILDIVHETLTYEQFEVRSISNSSEVLPVIDEFNPDLIILDFRLAGTNGGEICKTIKVHPRFGNIPVIIFSAYFNNDDHILNYGCDGIINKPFDLAELVEKVNNLI